jgi:OOP family OmpA-OmpF porin
VEGHKVIYCYYFDRSTGKPPASGLQIKRNYQNGIKALGGQVLYDNRGNPYSTTTLRVTRSGQETWVEVQTVGEHYYVTIVERQVTKQQVTAKADALKTGLAEAGHAEVTGIFFDFNKADLKPESKPARRIGGPALARCAVHGPSRVMENQVMQS